LNQLCEETELLSPTSHQPVKKAINACTILAATLGSQFCQLFRQETTGDLNTTRTDTAEIQCCNTGDSWLIEHGLTSAPTQYRLYCRRFFTGQKTQPTVSKYWRRKLQRKTTQK